MRVEAIQCDHRSSCEHLLISVRHGAGERPTWCVAGFGTHEKVGTELDPTRTDPVQRALSPTLWTSRQQTIRPQEHSNQHCWAFTRLRGPTRCTMATRFLRGLRQTRRRPLRLLVAALRCPLLPTPRPHNEATENRAIEGFRLVANAGGSFSSIGAADPSTLAGEGAATPAQCAIAYVNRRLILSERR